MAIDYTKRAPAVATGTPGTPPSLHKVTLTKSAPTVSLTKQTGRLRVNLNWTAQPGGARPAGLLQRLTGSGGIDLDLGCLYELTDGTKGVVQALGNAFGGLDTPPYIYLDGDDRSGASSAGETMYINLAHAAQIRRVLVFACIYQGAAGFDQADGVVTLEPAAGPAIEVRLDDRAGGARMCAVALIEGDGAGLSVRREVRYVQGSQSDLDAAYGWGMRWARGRK